MYLHYVLILLKDLSIQYEYILKKYYEEVLSKTSHRINLHFPPQQLRNQGTPLNKPPLSLWGNSA